MQYSQTCFWQNEEAQEALKVNNLRSKAFPHIRQKSEIFATFSPRRRLYMDGFWVFDTLSGVLQNCSK